LFSRALFNTFHCFPILFCCGEKGSGKTTFCRWIMNSFFGIDTHGKPLGSTEKHGMRLLAKRCSTPAWYDEFRDGRGAERHISAFNSVYNRQGYGRARKSGDLKTDSVDVRGTLLLSGISPPRDESLQARCVYMPFSLKGRDTAVFREMERNVDHLNAVATSAMLRYDELAPIVVKRTREAFDVFFDQNGDSRLSLNYAMVTAAFDAVFEGMIDSSELVTYVSTQMASTGAQLAEEHPVNEFWGACEVLHSRGQITRKHIAQSGDRINIWLSGVYAEYERDYRMRKGAEPPHREIGLRALLGEQEYFAGMERKSIGGVQRRVVSIRVDKAPDVVLAMADVH
jgi:hypothetical protein